MAEKVVDVHLHPFAIMTDDHLLTEMDKAGVDTAVLLALDVDPTDLGRPITKEMIHNRLLDMYFFDVKRVMEELKVFLELARIDNEQVADFVKRHPDRFVGFGSIDLSKSQAYVEEKIREIDRLNLKGIKLIPTLQFFNPVAAKKNVEKLFEYCEKKRKIVTCHTGCDPYIWEQPHFSQDANPKYLKPIVQDFVKVKVIVAHMGCYSAKVPGVWMDGALELGKENENVWFDIAAVPYVVTYRKLVEKVRKNVGFDRVLFGSDYPSVGGGVVSIESMVAEVKNSKHVTEEEKEKILGLNAMRLFGSQSK
ncbi:MAG: amidohydrolase family protein [Candidatus Bathyarchaeota archaeon]|nr:amidohydrolase family protein [Candidatus Bathyarchaeota archaeon]